MILFFICVLEYVHSGEIYQNVFILFYLIRICFFLVLLTKSMLIWYFPEYFNSDIFTRKLVWYIYQNICILIYLPEYLCSGISTRLFVFWHIYQIIDILIYLPDYLYSDKSIRLFVFWFIYQIFFLIYLSDYLYSGISTHGYL